MTVVELETVSCSRKWRIFTDFMYPADDSFFVKRSPHLFELGDSFLWRYLRRIYAKSYLGTL